MSQSTKIFGLLVFLFFVFITVKGELPAYIGVLTGAQTSGKAS